MKSPMINNFMKEDSNQGTLLKSMIKEHSTSMDTERGPFHVSVTDIIDFNKFTL